MSSYPFFLSWCDCWSLVQVRSRSMFWVFYWNVDRFPRRLWTPCLRRGQSSSELGELFHPRGIFTGLWNGPSTFASSVSAVCWTSGWRFHLLWTSSPKPLIRTLVSRTNDVASKLEFSVWCLEFSSLHVHYAIMVTLMTLQWDLISSCVNKACSRSSDIYFLIFLF